ncbi:SUMF1/EgtB/PvdO family nonheme iron enzyme [Pontiellaceae bacterium B12227]|nr:SUMF1/EgtB/PvdO family nonheme iron enzyme [Pontiellaceae bacterium B12227]
MSISGGAEVSVIGGISILNRSTLRLGSEGTLTVGSDFNASMAGFYWNSGSTLAVEGQLSGLPVLGVGKHLETPNVLGDLTVHGTFAPGNSPANSIVDGAFTNASDGTLEMELGGYVPGTEYDQLTVTGLSLLDGTLNLVFLDNFSPTDGASFDLFNWDGGVSGEFASINLPPLPDGSIWNISELYTTGKLSVMWLDTDGDGMTDRWELENGLNPLVNDALSDADTDHLSALQEFGLGTDPNNTDSDDDGLSDFEEVRNIVAWGDNYYRQTIIPSNAVNAVALSAGGAHSLALLANNTVVAWGDNYYQQCDVPESVSNVMAIAAGDSHSLATLSTGTVVAWGDNFYQQTNVPASATNMVDVSAGVEHSMGLRNNGHVVVWGNNYYGVRDIPPSVTNAISISAGGYHNLALLAGGQVVAWGDNTHGACNVPLSASNAVAIAAGGYHSVALLADGNIIAWGQNDFNQSIPPTGITNATAIAAGGYHNLALHSMGDVAGWGSPFYDLGNIPTNVKYPTSIEGGRLFSLALMNPTDPLDADSDDDGLNDGDEVNVYGTAPLDSDTDDDGMPDGWEATYGLEPLTDDAGLDKDEDLLSNVDEFGLGTNPDNPDSDADGLMDGVEVNTYGTDPLDADSDDDGLSDGAEVNTHGTGPLDSDSDDDGLSDGAEVNTHGTDPLDADSDDDGLSDGEEIETYSTNPLNADTDGDSFGDGQEVAHGGSPLISDTWRVEHVRNNGTEYDLYPASTVMELAPGQVGFEVSNGEAWLALQLEESGDLISWKKVGDEVIWSIPVHPSNALYRVRGGSPYTGPPPGMVQIPAGVNAGTDPDFGPYTLATDEFFMDEKEVSFEIWTNVYQWAVTNGYTFENPGLTKAAGHPVHSVSWFDIAKWCNARSEMEGRVPCYQVGGMVYRTGSDEAVTVDGNNGYRLPSRMEWEYAARGGLIGARFPWGDDATHLNANYTSSSALPYDVSPTRGPHPDYDDDPIPYTSPCGAFPPNRYGLYDMAGNVWEWCNDITAPGKRARASGGYGSAAHMRCGFPADGAISDIYHSLGFRTICR